MNSRQKNLQFIFIILASVMLVIEIQNLSSLRLVIKPLLMPVLILFLLVNSKLNWKINAAILALILSCCGDILLLFDNQSYFIGGLIAFLLAHICYIIIFLSDIKFNGLFKNKFKFIFILITIIYIISFYLTIRENLGAMKTPVIAYIVIISCMVIAAAMRESFVNNASFLWILFGAIFFVISDSLLAVIKFVTPFQWANTLVMIFYMLAQLSIVKGIILNKLDY